MVTQRERSEVANTFESFDQVYVNAFDWYKRTPRHERLRIAHTFRVPCRPTPRRKTGTVDLQYLHLVLKAILPLFKPAPAPLRVIPTLHILPPSMFKNAIAYYKPETICFNDQYLNRTPEQIENTMKHELLHAWLHQYGFRTGDSHGIHFRVMATYLGVKL
jgi:hypothetical protein